jgi:L-amino acid N-acyltransferase YncA
VPAAREAVDIRVARPGDLPALVAVYNQAVRAGFQTGDLAPVSVASRRGWLAAHPPERHPVYVAERDGVLAGWLSLSPYRPYRTALAHTAEVSYYVDAGHRRQGVATALLRHALASCDGLGIHVLLAFVLDVNAPSCRLLEREGYARWGHLPGVARFGDVACGHLIYGRRLTPA